MIFYTSDNIGFVGLSSCLASDLAVVDAARFCYASESDNMGPRDLKLLERLVKSNPSHNTVFEHPFFTFHVKSPIFIARQWMRHRIGTFNERSLRYTQAKMQFWVPETLNLQERLQYRYTTARAFEVYEQMLDNLIPKEEARAIIPVNVYTEFLWTVNAWSLMNYLSKRLDKHAQGLHREYAGLVMNHFEDKMPYTARFFKERSNG